jgi:hypothetical protein
LWRREQLAAIKKEVKESRKSSLIVYLILRALVILCLVLQILRGDLNNAFLCIWALMLFTVPLFVERAFKIDLPNMLETIIFLFIFAAEILGEINNFYLRIPHWDTMLHTINGFLCAGIGFALIDLLNKNSKKIKLSPSYVAIVAFCFSMTVGVCWEFFEFAMDDFVRTDMQKDRIVQTVSSTLLDETKTNKSIQINEIEKTVLFDKQGNQIAVIVGGYLDIGIIDTMKDLFVNLLGAVLFSIIGYFYIKNKEKYKFAENFIPQKTEE